MTTSATSAADVNPSTTSPPGDRRRTGIYLVQLVLRYFVGIAMIFYAATKFAGTQLTGEPSTYATPMALLTGFELTWSYYGWAGYYRFLIGFAEVTAAFLLFFRPTARLGYLLALGLLGAIVPMDLAYGISSGTEAAITLLAATIVLAVLDRKALIDLVRAPLRPALPAPRWTRRLWPVKVVVIAVAVAGISTLFAIASRTILDETELQGAWQFRASEGPTHLLVDRGSQCYVRFETRTLTRPAGAENCTIDQEGDTLRLSVPAEVSPTGEAFGFAGTYAIEEGGLVLRLTPSDATDPAHELWAVPQRNLDGPQLIGEPDERDVRQSQLLEEQDSADAASES